MRSDLDMQTDPEGTNSRVVQKRMLEQIVAIPATLYLPTSIVAELNEICETLGYTPEQLVIEALRGQIDYWNEFYEYSRQLRKIFGPRQGLKLDRHDGLSIHFPARLL